MYLNESELNKFYLIEDVLIEDKKLQIRLMQLGIFPSNKISLIRFSPGKKTVLVNIFNTVFALKVQIASQIMISKNI